MHQQNIGEAEPDDRLSQTRLTVVLTTIVVTIAQIATTVVLIVGLAANILLSQQVGVLHLLGLIARIVGNLDGTVTDRTYTAIVTGIVRILCPVGP